MSCLTTLFTFVRLKMREKCWILLLQYFAGEKKSLKLFVKEMAQEEIRLTQDFSASAPRTFSARYPSVEGLCCVLQDITGWPSTRWSPGVTCSLDVNIKTTPACLHWPGQASPYHEPSDRPVVGIQQERAQGADLRGPVPAVRAMHQHTRALSLDRLKRQTTHFDSTRTHFR